MPNTTAAMSETTDAKLDVRSFVDRSNVVMIASV